MRTSTGVPVRLAPGPRLGGCCVCCDAPVYTVKAFDPRTKRPTRLGVPIEGAAHGLFLQVNGSRVEMSFCEVCAAAMETVWSRHIAAIWQRVILAMCLMRDGQNDPPPDPQWIESHNRAIAALVANPPIAYIGARALQAGGVLM